MYYYFILFFHLYYFLRESDRQVCEVSQDSHLSTNQLKKLERGSGLPNETGAGLVVAFINNMKKDMKISASPPIV